jgi:hypothetical protein
MGFGQATFIMFTDTSLITNSIDGVLDNLSVTAAIPLPYTFGLIIAGAPGLLVAHRRWLVAGSR